MVLEGGYGGLLGLYYPPSVTAGLSATLETTGLRLHARPAPALGIKNKALQGDGTGEACWPLSLTSPCRTWGRQCQSITVLFSSGPERAFLLLKLAFQGDTTYQSCQGHKTYWLSLT